MVTKDDYKTFFTNKKFNILSIEDFSSIVDFCDFSLEMPQGAINKVAVNVVNKQILPFNIYQKLIDNKIPNLVINIRPSASSDNYFDLPKYISLFLDTYYKNSCTLRDLLAAKNLSAQDKTINFLYVNDLEKQEVQTIEKELLLFLNKVGYDLIKINYVVDQAKLNLIVESENQKKKALMEAAAAIAAQEVDPLAKYKKAFLVKGPFIPLSEAVKIEGLEDRKIRAKVSGEIFSLESKTPLKRSDIRRYTICIYDYNMGALRLTYVCDLEPKQEPFWKVKAQIPTMPKIYMDTFKVGDWINAEIFLERTKYTNFEVAGSIIKMCKTTKPGKFIGSDNAPKKRVELLVHSNYTAYDGIDTVDRIYEYAKECGHSAIAVTDRHNVQAYPDIVNHIKNKSVKRIYGVEMELIEDMIPVCVNPHSQDLNKSKYVIFDIETTGLYPEYEDLIEFGAIKWENGQITNSLDFFVKPTKPLTNVAINMSHITEEMVKEAINQKQALLKIKEYIGDSILIAHNGIRFDLNFLNKLCERFNVEPINNTLIDTLEISHSINSDLSRHNLGTLTRKLKFEYNELIAHRADKDAEYLLYVWQDFLKRLIEMKVTNVDQINSALQNNTLRANRRGTFVDIYAKTQKGIKAIYKIVSKGSTDQIYIKSEDATNQIGSPKIHWSNINEYRDDIIVCPHPMDGCIWEATLSDRQENLEAKMKQFDYIFVAPSKNYEHLIEREEITKTNVNKAISKIIQTAKKLNIKVCAVSDAYYCMAYEKKYHEILVYNPQLGGKSHWLYRTHGKVVIPDYHILTTDEMIKAFSWLKDEKLVNEIVIDNTNYFASSTDVVVPIKSLKLNKQGVPKYPYSPKIEGSEKFLTDLVWKNANLIWGNKIPNTVRARIEKELNAIISNGYAVIYWISHLLVKKSNEDGYLVGSRGSVGSSVVAYLSKISEVNPLPPHYICKKCHHYEEYDDVTVDGFDLPPKKCPVCGEEMFRDGHNIPFESFLGQDCDKIPDIDLNFSGEYQAKAHNFIKEMFGDKHAFRAGTIGTVAQKTAYGYVKKYFERTEPNNTYSGTLTDALGSKCVGVKKTTGQHPGGIVVVPQDMDIEDFCPCQYPSNDKASSWMTTHFDYHQMNEVLLKFDILGHDEPTILNHLQKSTGIDPRTIPYFDDKVIEMFANSKSIGIIDEAYDTTQIATFAMPEFGTVLTRKIVLETKPTCVGDLIKISGLSHGTGVWQGNAQDLIKSGLKINQVICCREDIVDYLFKAGLSFMTAFKSTESIRKGRGVKPEHEQEMVKNNVPKYYIDSCKKIEYLFPKAHATAYVIDAIRTAWYKVYYPVHFYAVWMSIRSDKAFDIASIYAGKEAVTNRLKEINTKIATHDKDLKDKDEELVPILEVSLEMFARGIRMANIDINKSLATDFIPEGNTIIPPFVAVDGLGAENAKKIVDARNDKPFTSIADFQKRTRISSTTIQKLKDLHVLDGLAEDEQMRLF